MKSDGEARSRSDDVGLMTRFAVAGNILQAPSFSFRLNVLHIQKASIGGAAPKAMPFAYLLLKLATDPGLRIRDATTAPVYTSQRTSATI